MVYFNYFKLGRVSIIYFINYKEKLMGNCGNYNDPGSLIIIVVTALFLISL